MVTTLQQPRGYRIILRSCSISYTRYSIALIGPRVSLCPTAPPNPSCWDQITKYHKDIDFAYRPFLSLLGTGIVTSDGPKWRKQRNKVKRRGRVRWYAASIKRRNVYRFVCSKQQVYWYMGRSTRCLRQPRAC